MSDDAIPKPTFSEDGLDEVEYQAVATAYFQSAVGLGTAARQRAQAGFAIVSAIAGAVVAFSLSSTISGSAGLTKAFTYASLAFWAVCAILFLTAAILQPLSSPATQDEKDAVRSFPSAKTLAVPPIHEADDLHVETVVAAPSDAEDELLGMHPVGFVAYVFRLARGDAHHVSWWTILAGWAAGLAMVALLGAAGGVLFDSVGPPQTNAIVTVNDSFFSQYEAQCEVQAVDPALRDVVGQVGDTSLTSGSAPYVDFQAASGTCGSDGHFIIPRSDVVSIEEYNCPLADVAAVSGIHAADPLVPCTKKATPLRDIFRAIARALTS